MADDLSKEQKMEQTLFIYKRALSMLSKVTVSEVREHLSCSFEEYVHAVANKHLELAKPFELPPDESVDCEEILFALQEGELVDSMQDM